MKNRMNLPFIMMVLLPLMIGMGLNAQDWAQWRGPGRDGVSKETGLHLDWSASKPSLTWVFRQAGSGYSSPSIVETSLYCQGSAKGNDFAFALDTKTGNLKWKQNLGDEFVQDRGNGPRGSITVDGDKLYLIRGGGQIHCLSTVDGKVLWQKDFVVDFKGKIMSRWGYSESPLIDGDLVICTPGSSGGTMIALDKNTGAVVWRTKEWTDDAGHSSPIVAEVDGIRQYIQQSAKGVAGVSAKDGKLLWKVNVDGYRTAVIPTPVYHDGFVYVTSGYNAGCTGIRLTKEGDNMKTDVVYTNKNIANQHGGVVLIDGYVYGHSDNAGWVCLDLKTGERAWSQRNREGVARGCVLGVDGRLILLDERSGKMAVITASPDGYKEFGLLEIPERFQDDPSIDKMVWTHPVVANGNLYVRDHDLLFCFNLKK